MSGFLNPIRAEDLPDGRRRRLLEPIVYHVGAPDSPDRIVIPAGFITDGGSVPRILWAVLDPWGPASKPYVLHDFLYHTGLRSRLVSDAIFMEAMEVVGVGFIRRKILYRGVRLGGWWAWWEHRRRQDRESVGPEGGLQ